jgi:hypothetical protein
MVQPAADQRPIQPPALERRNGASLPDSEDAGDSERADKNTAGARAFRGLIVSLLFSLLNLVGLLFTAQSLGVIGRWSAGEFIGLFGLLETALGLASVVLPNIWHLPVTEVDTSKRTRVSLAVSSVFVPHWGGLARTVAGIVLLLVFGADLNMGFQALLVVPLVLALALLVISVSLIAARLGVARPDIDVIKFTVEWIGRKKELPGISLGASIVQFVLGVMTLPLADALPPSVLYDPHLAPSPDFLLAILGATAIATVLGVAAWRGRMTWKAPLEQQKDIEENA